MDLLKTFDDFAGKDKAVERAAFEAAMIEKLAIEPYKMSDLLFEIYSLRKEVTSLGQGLTHAWIEIEGLEDEIDSLRPKKRSKK